MNNYPDKSLNIAIHIMIWAVIISMPHLIGLFANALPPRWDWGMVIMPVQIIILFYLNYLYLINKYLFNKKVGLFIAANMAIIIAFVAVGMVIREIALSPPPEYHYRNPHPRMIVPVVMNVITSLLDVVLCVAIKMTNKWYEERRKVQELEKASVQAELQQLKSQLNPHFLFNSLNNIYALISFNPDKAQISLLNLCEMLRYQLYEANRETIPVSKEIEFVKSYCNLMSLRFSKNIDIELDLSCESNNLVIAPLLFIPLVENAFKHGVSPNEKSSVSIKIYIVGGYVQCIVRNSYFPKKDNDRSGSGIGLENLKRRLELLYPGAYMFAAKKVDNEFIVQLKIKPVLK